MTYDYGRHDANRSQLFPALGSQALIDIHLRNLDAFAKVSSAFGVAAGQIAEKQLEIIKAFTNTPHEIARQSRTPKGGFAEIWETQYQNGRAILESTAQQFGKVNDVLRDCYSEVASEFEACARDNLNAIGANLEKGRAQAERGMKEAAQTSRNIAEAGAEVARKSSDAASKAARSVAHPAAE